jgi:hypothetical protein
MAYQVDKFNGAFFVSVEDGTIDTTSDLRFVGKNYAGYGEVQNENFLHLLENFSNTTAPPKVITGQIWFDSANKKLKFYDGSRFKLAGGAEVSTTAPSGLSTGDFWWDSAAKQLYAWTGTEFALIGPEASPDLGSSIVSAAVVKGTVSTAVGPHTILKIIADDKVIGIFSKTSFTLDNAQNTIDDFTVIKKGFTLAKSQSGVSTDDYVMWGTANNAARLGGFAADQYLKQGENSFTGEVQFYDPGLTVGDGNDFRLRVEGGDEVIVENRLGNPITFRITVTETTDERDIAVITSTGVVPGNDNAYSLGANGGRWSNVYATTHTGNLVGNVTGNSLGVHTGNVLASDNTVMINAATKQIGFAGANIVGTLTGSVTGTASAATNASKLNDLDPSATVPGTAIATIPVRNTSGNILANQFVGIADKTDKTFIDKTDAVVDPAWNDATTSTKYRTARLTATAYSIAARDSSGNISAVLFQGTATSARYADLAEKYLADTEYEVGTVMVIGGPAEVTASSYGELAIGVISENPAYMMNSELEGGVYVALKGRVPIKVKGSVRKGDRLVAGDQGCAQVAQDRLDVFAVAMETSDNEDVKLIQSVVL